MAVQHTLPKAYVSYLDRLFAGSERKIAAAVRGLSDAYVGKTARTAFGTQDRVLAYTAYYGPVNALKVKIILDELALRYPDKLGPDKLAGQLAGGGALRVLDVGAGPGSATAGVCLALLDRRPGQGPEQRIESVCLDTDPLWTASAAGSSIGTDFVQPWVGSGKLSVIRQTARLDDGAKNIAGDSGQSGGKFDLAVAANVVNELEGDVKAQAQSLDRLFRRALRAGGADGTGGVALVVEPALREPTRRLHEIRGLLLGTGWKILAPCTGSGPCPMLRNDRDWCHETRDWLQPDFHHRIDQLAGFKKDALRFSFLALSLERSPPLPMEVPTTVAVAVPVSTTATAPPETGGAARVVSEMRREKGRTRFHTCDSRSDLQEWDVLERVIRDTPEWGNVILDLERGDLVKIPHGRGGRLSPADPFGRLF